MKIFSISMVIWEIKILPKWTRTMPSLESLKLNGFIIPSAILQWGCRTTRIFIYCWWKYNMIQPLWITADKRGHTVWFHLHATWENTNLIYSDRKQIISYHRPRWGENFVKRHKGIFFGWQKCCITWQWWWLRGYINFSKSIKIHT